MEVATYMLAKSGIRILERVTWCNGRPESIHVNIWAGVLSELV